MYSSGVFLHGIENRYQIFSAINELPILGLLACLRSKFMIADFMLSRPSIHNKIIINFKKNKSIYI